MARHKSLLCVALALGLGCGKRAQTTAVPSATASAAAGHSSQPKSGPLASSSPAAEPKGCRAMSLSGKVQRMNGAPLAAGELFDGLDWLELESGAKVTLKHTSSAREWQLVGPARARPCRDGGEQVALASGRLIATMGAGARPGAEVLVFTPHGAARYGDAALSLDVKPQKLELEVRTGEVWLDRLDAKEPVQAVPIGKPLKLAGTLTVATLEQRCEALAQRAAELGAGFTAAIAPSARADLSTRAVEHLKARRSARVMCGVGEAFAGGLEPPERGRLLDRFTALERSSRTFPAQAGAVNP